MNKTRRLNLSLLLVLGLTVGTQAYLRDKAHAQSVQLYRPTYTQTYLAHNSAFDHNGPTYCNQNYPPYQGIPAANNFVSFDGTVAHALCARNSNGDFECINGWHCYDGHNGYDVANTAYVPVVASADGTVAYAGWHSSDHEASYGLEVEINHSNQLLTKYGHLSMVRYTTGESVGRWQIGTSGNTGNSGGSHLHFGVYKNTAPNTYIVTDPYGWSGPGADPYTAAPSTYLWASNPAQNPPTYYGSPSVLDDVNAYFYCSNPPCSWSTESGASSYGGSFRWTSTVNSSSTSYHGAKFILSNLPSTGLYEVEVYIPSPAWLHSSATNAARYTIVYFDAAGTTNFSKTVVVDQHDAPGQWISLGRYTFKANNGLNEVTASSFSFIGSYNESGKRLIVDAIRIRKAHCC